MSNTSVYGIAKNQSHLDNALSMLRDSGFRAADISVLQPDTNGSQEVGVENSTKSPEGAATGGAAGAVTGGVAGWLVGIGALAIPGVGPFIAAGPIMAALAGMGAGAALGGASGALVGLGIPKHEAQRYEGRVKNGGILLSVHCEDAEWSSKAEDLLARADLEDVSSASEADADSFESNTPIHQSSLRS